MKHLLAILVFLAPAAHAGIGVRWLANPVTDSVSVYSIQRDGAEIGRLARRPGDTLEFPDTLTVGGVAYRYTIVAHAFGVVSDTSAATIVGFPLLNLPDTLRAPQYGSLEVALPSAYHPLRGLAPLEVTAPAWVTWDSVGHRLSFAGLRAGRNERVAVRFCYYGKFCAADTVLVIQPPAKPGTPRNLLPQWYWSRP